MQRLLSVAGVILPNGSRLPRSLIHINERGKIVDIVAESAANMSPAVDFEILDRRSCTLIPLLADAHVHLAISDGISESPAFHTQEMVDRQLSIYLRYGVGHVLSLGTDQRWLETLAASRQERLAEGFATPYSAGTGFGARGGWPPELTVPETRYRPTDPNQAREKVRLLAKRGIRILKIWIDDFAGNVAKMPVPTMCAIIEEAHHYGLKVLAHVFYLQDARDLVNAGIDGLAHSVRDQLVTSSFADQVSLKKVLLIPTLSREEAASEFSRPENAYLRDPFFQSCCGGTISALRELRSTTDDSQAAAFKKNLEIAMENLRTMHAAGVRICMGTDAGFQLKLPGFSQHRELTLMHQAGLSASEVLAAATGRNYELFAPFASKLEAGQPADFCLLGGDPLDDLSQTKNICEVWQNGIKIWPKE